MITSFGFSRPNLPCVVSVPTALRMAASPHHTMLVKDAAYLYRHQPYSAVMALVGSTHDGQELRTVWVAEFVHCEGFTKVDQPGSSADRLSD